MKTKEAIMLRFQELLSAHDMTLNALANASGVTPSSVYSMFDQQSRKDVGILLIKKLCDGLEISLKEFFDADIFNALDQEIE